MVYVIFSDIHSNLEAIKAFEKKIKELAYGKLVCLGDIVGYGADPNLVIQWVRLNCRIVLGGNHDFAAVGKTETSYFNPHAFQSCIWTRKELDPINQAYLRSLLAKKVEDEITWAHSSPFEPEKWHYITSARNGDVNFNKFHTRLCFVGHSHIPLILEKDPKGNIAALYNTEYFLKPGHRYIFNVGSLGQPRDNNPDPCFVSYESKKGRVRFYRFNYDIETTKQKIMKEGLPQYLADRLSIGH